MIDVYFMGNIKMLIYITFVIKKNIGSSWFHSDELEMDGTATMIPRREPIKSVKVHQVSLILY